MSTNGLIDFMFAAGQRVKARLPLILLIPMAVMLMGSKGGCKKKLEEAKDRVPDVRGNYNVIHEDTVTVKVTTAGFTKTYHGVQGGVINVGFANLDLSKICHFPGVHCPSEAFWHTVAIDQPFINKHLKPYNPWLLKVTNLDASIHPLAYTVQKGGLINQHGDMVLGLGFGVVPAGLCGMMGSSKATASFDLDGHGHPTGDIINGTVSVTYSGACLFPFHAGFWGSKITLKTPFVGTRIGGVKVPKGLKDNTICDENGQKLMPPR